MAILDIILGALILLGIVRGLMKGLFVEVTSIVALIAGIYGAVHYRNFMANIIIDYFIWDEKIVNVVSFAITFVLIVLIIGLSGKALTKLANFAALGILNKLLGGVFGGLKIALILSVLLLISSRVNKTISIIPKDFTEESILYEPVKSLIPWLFPSLLNNETKGGVTANKEVVTI